MNQRGLEVKICGICEPTALHTCVEAGARFIGFVFYPPSPRHVSIDTAADLVKSIPTGVRAVGLFVDPTDDQLAAVLGRVQIDMIQLHGDETPARVAEIKALYHMPVMKAIRVNEPDDLHDIEDYEAVVDWLLFDAKPPQADLPGGTGETFDWSLLKGKTFKKPWMLSGGLTQDNLSDALSILKPDTIDVSSGVERTRGVKDIEKIKTFIREVKSND